MNDPLKPSPEPTLPDFDAPTSSLASAAGTSRSASRAGRKIKKFGQAHVPVSPTPRRASKKATPTSATSGPTSSGSSRSAALNTSLANRLRARLSTVGSIEYKQTWKESVTPSGTPYWAHTASARTIYVNVSTGALLLKDWATATASKLTQSEALTNADGTPWDGSSKPWQNGNPVTTALTDRVLLCGMPTPKAQEDGRTMEQYQSARLRAYENRKGKTSGGPSSLQGTLAVAVQLAGFPTTKASDPDKSARTTRDSKSEGKDGPNRKGSPSLPQLVHGVILPLFFVPTGRRVVLAPEFSLWLMGFPEAWVTAAPGAKDWREAQAALALECSREAGTP